MGVRTVVSSTRNKLMPSIPTWYWTAETRNPRNGLLKLHSWTGGSRSLKTVEGTRSSVRSETISAMLRMAPVLAFLHEKEQGCARDRQECDERQDGVRQASNSQNIFPKAVPIGEAKNQRGTYAKVM